VDKYRARMKNTETQNSSRARVWWSLFKRAATVTWQFREYRPMVDAI